LPSIKWTSSSDEEEEQQAGGLEDEDDELAVDELLIMDDDDGTDIPDGRDEKTLKKEEEMDAALFEGIK
jgi:hypothetical protein